MLVSVCLHRMIEEYRVFLEYLSFPSFAKLMEAARLTNESVRRSSKSDVNIRPSHAPMGRQMQRKRPILVAINDTREAGPTSSKRPYEKKERYSALPPLLSDTKRAIVLLEQRVKDRVIRLPCIN